MKPHADSRNLVADVLLGAAAGAAATWVMDRVTTVLYDREPADVRARENAARGKKNAYEVAAEKGASFVDHELTADQRKRVGSAIHWSLGIASGGVYGALRNRMRTLRAGSGVAYGVAVWLLLDEASLTILGLAPSPAAFPWQTHARGLAGHLVLGAAIESVFDLIDLAR